MWPLKSGPQVSGLGLWARDGGDARCVPQNHRLRARCLIFLLLAQGSGHEAGLPGPSVVFLTLCLNVIFSLQVSQVLPVVVPLPVAGCHTVMLCCRSDVTTFLYVRESLSLGEIQTALELGSADKGRKASPVEFHGVQVS